MAIETRYAKSGDASVAYQVISGGGPLDIVLVPCWLTHLDRHMREPRVAAFMERLGSLGRLITFDKRGTGLSDPTTSWEPFVLETRMEDLTAVLDAVGSERTVLFGLGVGGQLSALYAATYPERVQGLILMAVAARGSWAPDYPWAPTAEEYERQYEYLGRAWGGPVWIDRFAPSAQHDQQFSTWWAECLRSSAGPAMATTNLRLFAESDIRSVLPAIRRPTLVLHRQGDRVAQVEEGRFLAEQIPGARFVELPGADHLPYLGEQEPVFREISRFLARKLQTVPMRRALATVVSANISGIAGAARHIGPDSWADTRASLRSEVRDALKHQRSLATMQQGHGLVAAFDGPSRAIHFAREMVRIARSHGVRVQIGMHAGTVEHAEEYLNGIATELASRIAMMAGPDEVLASSTVVGLVSGTDWVFVPDDRKHAGLPSGVRLFTVADQSAPDVAPVIAGRSRTVAELSPREREVAFEVSQGKSNREVGEVLSISTSTVERHVANILMKLEYRSRTQLSTWAAEQHLTVSG